MDDDLTVVIKKFNFWQGIRFEIRVYVPAFCASSNKTQLKALFKTIVDSDTPYQKEEFINIMKKLVVPDFNLDLLLTEKEQQKIKRWLEDIDNGKM